MVRLSGVIVVVVSLWISTLSAVVVPVGSVPIGHATVLVVLSSYLLIMVPISGFELFISYVALHMRSASPEFSLDVEGDCFTFTFCYYDDLVSFRELLTRLQDSSFTWVDNSDGELDPEEGDDDFDGTNNHWGVSVTRVAIA